MHLQQGTLLKSGDYRIEKVLGQGGFGITYLAEQVMLGRKVCVKEFFMKDLCERDESTSHVTVATSGLRDTVNRFREKFLKEARNIARMKHPNIVSIIDVFEENGTAYYVMEYAECGSLSAKVKSMGYMPEPMAVRYILQVASALEYVHRQKMNHLDVKPANIMLNEEDNAVLIDFGLSKQYDASTGGQTSSTPVGISHGYAPLEQYKEGGVSTFSPETDIYALGATFYCLLTGQAPPSASDVNEDGLPLAPLKAKGVSSSVINLISAAMEPRKKMRLNNAATFIQMLNKINDNTPEGIVVDDSTRVIGAETNNNRSNIYKDEIVYDEDDDEDDEPFYERHKTMLICISCSIIAIIIAYAIYVNGNSSNNSEISDFTVVGSAMYEDEADEAAAVAEEDTFMYKEEAAPEYEAPAHEEDEYYGEDVYEVVEEQPSFPGGTSALMQYLSSNIKYPVVAQENGVQGRVVVGFIVDKDGSITNVNVLHGVDPSLDREAERVVKSMPKWIPGKQNGQNVKVKFNVPITFKLQ